MRKRILVFAAAFIALLLLSGCGKKQISKEGISFCNKTGTTIDNLYLSPVTEEGWGKALTLSRIKDGGSVHIGFSRIGGASGDQFDFGAINSEGRCFDVYDLKLSDGDTMELGPETKIDGMASTTMIVTHADGTSDTYFGFCYYESDLQGI